MAKDPGQADKRLSPAKGLHKLVQSADFGEHPVKRLEIVFQGDGAIVWRGYSAEVKEPVGGYVEP